MHSRLFALIYFTYFFMKRLFFTRTNLFLLISIVILQGCASLNLASKKSNIIETYIDLNAVDNDQLVVSLNPGSFPKGEVTFYMPSVIPGTYEYTDFGRFVSNFKAFDKNNQLIDVVKEGKNTWKIAEGKKLDRVSYVIDDTFDSPEGKKIYPMGGTKIEKDEVFLLNLHGFVGYFKGDLLYYNTPPVEDNKFVFKPNIVTYRVDTNSPIGQRISQSKTGVVIHRLVDEEGNESPLPNNVSDMFVGNEVFVVPPVTVERASLLSCLRALVSVISTTVVIVTLMHVFNGHKKSATVKVALCIRYKPISLLRLLNLLLQLYLYQHRLDFLNVLQLNQRQHHVRPLLHG